MKLLPKSALIQTSRVDHADWNYDPLLKYPARTRFSMVLSLIGRRRFQRLLEVGFGSGIFVPELASRCDDFYGIDVHSRVDAVIQKVHKAGQAVHLSRASACHTHFTSGFFDAIIAVSALEFIDDIESACRELVRIVKPGGRLFAVMPRKWALLDLALRLVTGEEAQRDYGDRRELVMPALRSHFRIVQRRKTPIYLAYELEPIQRDT